MEEIRTQRIEYPISVNVRDKKVGCLQSVSNCSIFSGISGSGSYYIAIGILVYEYEWKAPIKRMTDRNENSSETKLN